MNKKIKNKLKKKKEIDKKQTLKHKLVVARGKWVEGHVK